MRLLAFRGLKTLKSYNELKQIVDSVDASYMLRRRSTEVLYNSPLYFETASLLLHLFEATGDSQRPSILQRRGFLKYILCDYEDALALLDKLFAVRPKTAWTMGVYGHCLQQLGRIDEASTAYSEALYHFHIRVTLECRGMR
jgi:tetratricopeptide (TPR) repeat protein